MPTGRMRSGTPSDADEPKSFSAEFTLPMKKPRYLNTKSIPRLMMKLRATTALFFLTAFATPSADSFSSPIPDR